jgi:hypothetical protein
VVPVSSSSGGLLPRVGTGWYLDEVRLLHDFTLSLLDAPVMRAGQSVCLPLGIAASQLVSSVSFTFSTPAGHLSDVSLDAA